MSNKHTYNKMGVVILAAGDGKRMHSTLPKVMHELHGKPLIAHVVEAVEKTGLGIKPVVVVTPRHTLVQDYLGSRAVYAVQAEQLGTGHAVQAAEQFLQNKDAIVVLYGDMPFITSESIKRLINQHVAGDDVVTIMTVTVPDFEGRNQYFYDFGRIIRDSSGSIIKNIEKKDATAEQLTVKELNSGFYRFRADWLWQALKRIHNNNAQKEYYLTDLIALAIADGKQVTGIPVNAKEAIGINTKDHLVMAVQNH